MCIVYISLWLLCVLIISPYHCYVYYYDCCVYWLPLIIIAIYDMFCRRWKCISPTSVWCAQGWTRSPATPTPGIARHWNHSCDRELDRMRVHSNSGLPCQCLDTLSFLLFLFFVFVLIDAAKRTCIAACPPPKRSFPRTSRARASNGTMNTCARAKFAQELRGESM